MQFYPGFRTVQLTLDPLRELGYEPLASDILEEAILIAGRELTDKYPGIPLDEALHNWDRLNGSSFASQAPNPSKPCNRASPTQQVLNCFPWSGLTVTATGPGVAAESKIYCDDSDYQILAVTDTLLEALGFTAVMYDESVFIVALTDRDNAVRGFIKSETGEPWSVGLSDIHLDDAILVVTTATGTERLVLSTGEATTLPRDRFLRWTSHVTAASSTGHSNT